MQDFNNIELILGDDYQEYNKVLYKDNQGNAINALHYSYNNEDNAIYIHYCKNSEDDTKEKMISYLKSLSQKYSDHEVLVKFTA